MLMKILLSRSHPSPDVALGLVHVKHLSCFTGQGGIDLEEPFGHVGWCQVKNKNKNKVLLNNIIVIFAYYWSIPYILHITSNLYFLLLYVCFY